MTMRITRGGWARRQDISCSLTHTHTLAAHRDGVPSLHTATRGDSDQYNTNAQPGLSEDRSKNGGATTTTVRGNTRRFLQKARAAPRPYLRPTHYTPFYKLAVTANKPTSIISNTRI